MKKKKEKKNSEGKSNRIDNIFTIILSICDVIAIVVLFLLYGPYPNFRNWLVTTAMTTMSHQYFATTFYSEDKINKVLEENVTIEPEGNTDTSLIIAEEKPYIDKYDKEVLDELYKDYKSQLGNSYIDKYYNRMKNWHIIDEILEEN